MVILQTVFRITSKCLFLIGLLVLFDAPPGNAISAEFGRCLSEKGATFYGASWCPKCRAQRQALGRAMSYVDYVECSVGGDREAQRSVCDAAGIEGYPTWVFGDGSRASGRASLEFLADKTGCPLSGSRAEKGAERTDANGERRRNVGGALIIDVPE